MRGVERQWRPIVLLLATQGLVGCAGSDGADDNDDDKGGGGPTGVLWSADRARCEAICEDAQTEGCADFDHGACVNGCVDAEDFMEETTECEGVFREYLSCVEIQNPVCLAVPDPDAPGSEACNDEAIEYYECVIDYCVDYPSKDWCR
jgi:hypothetical protein